MEYSMGSLFHATWSTPYGKSGVHILSSPPTEIQCQQYLSCYWPDFDETLNVGSCEFLEQLNPVLNPILNPNIEPNIKPNIEHNIEHNLELNIEPNIESRYLTQC